jgi:hypothetical protein
MKAARLARRTVHFARSILHAMQNAFDRSRNLVGGATAARGSRLRCDLKLNLQVRLLLGDAEAGFDAGQRTPRRARLRARWPAPKRQGAQSWL